MKGKAQKIRASSPHLKTPSCSCRTEGASSTSRQQTWLRNVARRNWTPTSSRSGSLHSRLRNWETSSLGKLSKRPVAVVNSTYRDAIISRDYLETVKIKFRERNDASPSRGEFDVYGQQYTLDTQEGNNNSGTLQISPIKKRYVSNKPLQQQLQHSGRGVPVRQSHDVLRKSIVAKDSKAGGNAGSNMNESEYNPNSS